MEDPLVLGINGSPVEGGNTELLLEAALTGARRAGARTYRLDLNRMRIMPCQACGVSPEPDFCFFSDDMDRFYDRIAQARGIIFANPVYFDSVSAQSKLFIDRCNCFSPPVPDHDKESENAGSSLYPQITGKNYRFKPLLDSSRYGAAILVGSGRQDYLRPARVIRAFFKWLKIKRIGEMVFSDDSFERGSVQRHPRFAEQATLLGKEIVNHIKGSEVAGDSHRRPAIRAGIGGWRDYLDK